MAAITGAFLNSSFTNTILLGSKGWCLSMLLILFITSLISNCKLFMVLSLLNKYPSGKALFVLLWINSMWVFLLIR